MITSSLQTDKLLKNWINFRETLETDPSPLEAVAKFFLALPRVKFYTDPYDQTTWPTPWELVIENEFCPFNLVLGMCYTLQLTTRFSNSSPKIAIAVDNASNNVYYLLLLEGKVFGYLDSEWTNVDSLPKTLRFQKIFNMKPLH